MDIPYEQGGRTNQKRRTREAILAAARTLLAEGVTPSVEQAADAAGVSRTTAYRYFPNQRLLVLAVAPVLDRSSQLGDAPPHDAAARLELVVDEQIRILGDYEPQLRAALRFSLDPEGSGRGESEFRKGRAIAWFVEALDPLATTDPEVDRKRLALAIRSCCGIESLVWLVDVAKVSRAEAFQIMRRSARALLATEIAATAEPAK